MSGDPAYPVYAGGSGEWMKLGGEIYLDKKDALRFKIINNNDVSDNGNDLVLDDIIIRACAAPSYIASHSYRSFLFPPKAISKQRTNFPQSPDID